MITKEIALGLRFNQELWHNHATNADGTPVRVRVNGKCKVWKTRPECWRLPVIYGLKQYFTLGYSSDDGRVPWYSEGNPASWSLPERWPIERHWRGD